jgi:hypothetical protein
MKNIKIPVLISLLLILTAAFAFTAWASSAPAPLPEAQAALFSDEFVHVETAPWLVFKPQYSTSETGFIFYPGGRVRAESYAPVGRALAEQGFLVVIVPMPLNLAVLNIQAAHPVIDAYPEIKRWGIGGHSLGGAMAARFAYQNPGVVQGLALLASYPASGDDLSTAPIHALSIYGDRDGLLDDGNLAASQDLLPPTTEWIKIEGGNHAQFGWYGEQQGDRPALIDRIEQQALTQAALTQWLTELQQP